MEFSSPIEAWRRSRVAVGILASLMFTVSTAFGGGLQFTAKSVCDTFLTHDDVRFQFTATNLSDRPVAYRSMSLGSDDAVQYTLYDSLGAVVPHGSECILFAPGLYDSLLPGESIEQSGSLAGLTAPRVDQETWTGFVPPGSYEIVFAYGCDFQVDTLFEGSRSLRDTAHFVVMDPHGRDSLALLQLLEARRARARVGGSAHRKQKQKAEDAYLEACSAIADSFPNSPYLGQALGAVTSILIQRYAFDKCAYVDLRPHLIRYITTFPDDEHSLNLIFGMSDSANQSRRKPAQRVAFLKEVVKLVPGTRAGNLAKKQLAKRRK